MNSVCGNLEADSHLESNSASSLKNCSNASKHISCIGSEDSQESDGDDSSGYIHHNVNEETKDEDIIESITESLTLDSNDSNDESEENNNFAGSSQDIPSEIMKVVTIIPAIKGSREKHGKSLKKLNVTWAEDVYDPPPSIVSHTRNKKHQPQKKSKNKDNLKKNGKKGQKGSSSNSSSRGSKDKKSSSSSRNKHSRDKFDWTTQMPIVAASS